MRAVSVLPAQKVSDKKASAGARKVVVLSKNVREISNVIELPAKRNGLHTVLYPIVDCSTLDEIGKSDVGIIDLSHLYKVDDGFESLLRKIVQEERRYVHIVLSHDPENSRALAAHIRAYYGELSRSRRVWQGLSAIQREIGRILA